MSLGTDELASVIAARNANFVIFATCGIIGGAWWSRLPDIKQLLNISTGTLSLLLLCIAIGSMVSLPLTGRITEKFGAKFTLRLGVLVSLSGLLLAALTIQERLDPFWPGTALLIFGFGVGLWDVAQNIEGAAIEQRFGKSIMPWFHAAFSGGTILGALLGALATQIKLPVLIHLSLTILLAAICVAWASTHLSSDSKADRDEASGEVVGKAKSAWAEPRTLLIGLVVLAAAFTEGTANDWTAVAFVDGHRSSSTTGVLGLATFLTFMTAGRIFGTKVLDKYGRAFTLRVLFISAILGCHILVFGSTELGFIGAAFWGLGASLGFPVGMSAASDDPKRSASRISVVATMGYLSFIAGPVLIGFLGETVGMLRALLAVAAALALALLAIQAVKPIQPD